MKAYAATQHQEGYRMRKIPLNMTILLLCEGSFVPFPLAYLCAKRR